MGKALVTGAKRGIGKAIAFALADAGFDLAVVDLALDDDLKAVAAAIAGKGVKSVALACDIATINSHQKLLDDASDALGQLTTLVNNAGVSVLTRGELLDVTPESFDRCVEVNTRGTFFLTQCFSKQLRQTVTNCHRSIITVTSSNASAVSISRGEYCISKAATSMMSKLFAVRLADEDIGCYEIQPGFIETEMTAPSKAKYDAMIESGLTVIKRFGSPTEIGRIAVALATGQLPYTVGQPIQADGGLLTVRF
jgi:NAD(P)-dependent dehydrogenase (short-subunit alcohol dehydrogenase family)